MKRTGFVLAFVATVSMTVLPATPSFAAMPVTRSIANLQTTLADQAAAHVRSGDLAVLSPAQMTALARSNPNLHSKLLRASKAGTMPSLTPSEKRLVRSLSARNVDSVKAGAVWVPGWVIVVLVAIPVLLILWWLFMKPRPAVVARS
jgi:hypothetical protein